MSNLIKGSLNDFLQPLETGSRPKGGVSVEGEIPSLGGENVTSDGNLIFYPTKKITHDFFSSMTKGHLKPNDVLINKDGANTGKSSIYRKSPFAKAAINEHLFILRGKNGVLDQEYLHYFIQLPKIRHKVSQNITGSAQPGLNSTFVKNFQIEIHPFTEQKRIASILTSVDEVIEKTQTQINKLQDLKKATMNELLTRGIGHTEYKDSPVGRIPKSWDVVRLGELAFFQRGHDITSSQRIDGEFPVVSSSGIIGYHNEKTTQSPCVVVGRKGSIGSVHFVEKDFWAHDTSLYVIDFYGNHEKFIYYLTTWLDLKKYGTKSGSPSLNRNDIHPIKVAKPSVAEQKKITSFLSSMEEKIKIKVQKLKQFQSLKKSLMQDLLTGKVRVQMN